jgi:2-polyprenyl-3-methyl-5-hydroxy-6-metoxy-1,4-benzoquinol methylase
MSDASAPTPISSARLPFEPAPAFRLGPLQDDSAAADCHGRRIGILIVTYNALSTLVPVLKRITPNVWRNVEEVVIFDDASQDATFELAVGLKTLCDLAKLRVLKHPKNLGYGGNQKAGYLDLIQKNFDVVVLLHGDGQYAPEILASMYAPIVRAEADAVFGSRMMKTYGGPLKGGMPLYKYVGNRVLTYLENRALGMNLTEFHSGYRAYNLRALKAIDFSAMTDDFHFDTEIIIKLHHQGFRVAEVPIPTYYGDEICYVNGFRYARDVMRAVRRYNQTRRSVRRAPEFAEYFVHYPLKLMRHSSHDYAAKLVGAGQDVLDIGCGEGVLAAQLKANGNRIVGIDSLPAVPEHSGVDQYLSADLDRGIGPVLGRLGGKKFDCVLLLDVLEHLRQPELLLQQCRSVLRDNGRLIVSLPNVANITVRLALLTGRFSYTERGILDRTHLRFFTLRTARQLLEQNDWEIVERRSTVMPFELALALSPEGLLARTVNWLLAAATRLWPTLLGYQTIFVARRTSAASAQNSGTPPRVDAGSRAAAG